MLHPPRACTYCYFQTYRTLPHQPVSKYTTPNVFQQKAKHTPLFLTFSTVLNPNHSPQTVPHPPRFPIKFYTQHPNSHLLPNNLKIFFIP
ncbi:catalase, partial [Virgibacillus sp. SK37]|uniref:catalase n=1 Tax=Virgibacillus sp. SK37 TaxID=403957 RepID=UPI0011A01666